MNSLSKPRGGFTLIELLAAGVLSGLLLVAVGSLLRSSYQETRVMQIARQRYPATDMLARGMRRDFQNARGLRGGRDEVLLHGYISSDPASGMPTHRLARVRYFIRESVLYREEQSQLSRDSSVAEPVWNGAGQFSVLATEDDIAGGSAADPATGSLPAMPSRVTIQLTSDNGDLILRETIFHHRMP